MKVLHVSYSDAGGGAFRAMMRLVRVMATEGIESTVLVARKRSDDPRVTGPSTRAGRVWATLRPTISGVLSALDGAGSELVRSYNVLPTGMDRWINASDADIVHLHWVGGETISIREIGRIRKPLVWTLRDMWPFCGAEHYEDPDCPDRYKEGYPPRSRAVRTHRFDLDRWTWRRKMRAWRELDLHIVGLSNWITACARDSCLFRNAPVTHIPNAIDLEQFKPRDQAFARDVLRLEPDSRIVLFGAMGGASDLRKGARYLYEALDLVWDRLAPGLQKKTRAVIFGAWDAHSGSLRMPIRALGPIGDDATLALAHAAADVFVAPSLQENLPNTLIEAAACGRPGVAFDIGGMPDAVVDGETGFLAPANDVAALAAGILELLTNDSKRAAFGAAARCHAEIRFAPRIVVEAYRRLYREASSRH